MMNSYLVNIDTATRVGAADPFQCTYKFSAPHRKVSCVALRNAQIPVGFYNVRAPYNTITISGVTYTVSPNNYTLATLIPAVNTAISGVGTLALESTNGLVTLTAGATRTISCPTPDLSFLIGFSDGQSGTSILASRPAITSFDTYIRIHIENLNVPSTETNPCTFKIPVAYGNDKLILWNELSQNSQQNVVLATSSHIDRLNIKVYDRFGGLLTNRGLDWSMTLEFVSNN